MRVPKTIQVGGRRYRLKEDGGGVHRYWMVYQTHFQVLLTYHKASKQWRADVRLSERYDYVGREAKTAQTAVDRAFENVEMEFRVMGAILGWELEK